jgi:mannose-6-phosphate isomerase-like protein (cupin superfamily)
MTPISKETAEHYTWGDACDGWHLLRTPTLSIIEERMPPATSERLHYHVHSRQLFYVLAGELTLTLDGKTHVLLANQALEIPPGQPHQALNQSTTDVRFLVTSQPPSHGDRIDR